MDYAAMTPREYVEVHRDPAFVSSLQSLLRRAMTNGVMLAQRPKGLKPDEQNAVLLPDMKHDPISGLRIGQMLLAESWKLPAVPWGLEATESEWLHKSGPHPAEGFYVRCFVRMTLGAKKCRVEGMFVALVMREQYSGGNLYRTLLGPRIFEFEQAKVLLYPVERFLIL